MCGIVRSLYDEEGKTLLEHAGMYRRGAYHLVVSTWLILDFPSQRGDLFLALGLHQQRSFPPDSTGFCLELMEKKAIFWWK